MPTELLQDDLKAAWRLDAERDYRGLIDLLADVPIQDLCRRPELGLMLARAYGMLVKDEAAETLLQALHPQIIRTADSRLWRTWRLLTSNRQFLHGNLHDAELGYLEFLDSATVDQSEPSVASALVNLAVVASVQCRYHEAIAGFTRALAMIQREGDKEKIASLHYNLAMCFLDLERLSEAQAHFLTAQQIFDEFTSERGLSIDGNMALIEYLLGYPAAAEIRILKHLDRCVERGFRRVEGEARRIYGMILGGLSRPSEAEEQLHLALDIARDTKNRLLIAECHDALAELPGAPPEPARRNAAEAAAMYRAIGAPARAERMMARLQRVWSGGGVPSESGEDRPERT